MQRGEQIYQRLREMIIDGELSSGESLGEQEISSRLGSSRTPVREAFQRLSREGLVKLVPGRGAFVTDIAIPDIVELFQMREALEPYASRLAALASDRSAVEPLLAELDKAPELIDRDAGAYYELTARLDACIVALTNNSRLKQVLEETWMQVRRARRVARTNQERLLDSVVEHRAILEAILDGDQEGAEQATRVHVRRSLRHILTASSVGISAAMVEV